MYRSDSEIDSDDEPTPPIRKAPVKKPLGKKATATAVAVKPAAAAAPLASKGKPAAAAPLAAKSKPAMRSKADSDARDARIAAKRAEIAARKTKIADEDAARAETVVSVVRDKVYICYGIYLTTSPKTYKPSELESFGIKYEQEASRTLYYTILNEFETEPAGNHKIPGDLATLLKYQGLFGMIYQASPLSAKKLHATQWRTDDCSPFYFAKT